MTTTNIAFLDQPATYRVAEEPGAWDADSPDDARHLHDAEGLIGEALNLAGLLLAALADDGDRRAMQVHTAVGIIEKKLAKACRKIDRYEMRHE